MFESLGLHEPELSGNEWKYVKECLDSGWVSSAGKFVDAFESEIARYTGSKYAVSCVNGSAALQLSLEIAGVNLGDEVIVPTITFIASVNAIHHRGAHPVFMDADQNANLDVEKTIQFLEESTYRSSGFTFNKRTGRRIRALMPVHVFGNLVKLDELVKLCRTLEIIVVEDAAEAMGSFFCEGPYQEAHAGTVGQVGCLSFNGNKIMTCGGGGMIITNDKSLAEYARYLSTQARDDDITYRHDESGYNFRLTNLQAAVGLAQLERLPAFLESKSKLHKRYQKRLSESKKWRLLEPPQYSQSNHWLNVVSVQESSSIRLLQEVDRLLEAGITVRPVWRPNHLQEPYRTEERYRIDQAEEIVNRMLCVPSSSGLSLTDVDTVVDALMAS